jgi:dTDP-4-dehydrorhamnose 3,5-epimerase
MMIIPTIIPGCKKIEFTKYTDVRGSLVKIFNKTEFCENDINPDWEDEYYSISNKHVIRGLHLQLPPYAHHKLVCCISGKVLDVVVDLRKNSPTYQKCLKIELSADSNFGIYIPQGCAHGIKAVQDNSIILCKTSCIYKQQYDVALLWSSCDVDWELDSNNPILSDRDANAIHIDNFVSPFL